jgi:hypothetical protein
MPLLVFIIFDFIHNVKKGKITYSDIKLNFLGFLNNNENQFLLAL